MISFGSGPSEILALTGKVGAYPQSYPMGLGGPPIDTMPQYGMPMGVKALRHQIQLIHTLGLTQSQHQKVWSIVNESRSKIRQQILALHQGRQQLRAMASSSIDQSKINELANSQGQVVSSLIKLRGQIAIQIRSVLTDEQKVRLSKIIANSSGNNQNIFRQYRPNIMQPVQ